jgi:hypothetical protein
MGPDFALDSSYRQPEEPKKSVDIGDIFNNQLGTDQAEQTFEVW